MQQLSFIPFGTGDGWPCADRGHSSFFYQFPAARIIVDAGESLSRAYKTGGFSYDLFDRLVLSHTHGDHVGGLFMFMQGLWLEKRTRPLTIHLPQDAIHPIRTMLEACYIFEELLGFPLYYEPLRPGVAIELDKVTITPFATTHLAGLKHAFGQHHPTRRFEAFSFFFQAPGFRAGHSADLGAVTDLEPLIKQPLDLLVCELAHFKAEELFEFLQGRALQKLVLTHLGREYWNNRSQVETLARRLLPGVELHLARDQQTIQF